MRLKNISVSEDNERIYEQVIGIVGKGNFSAAVFYSLERSLEDGALKDWITDGD